MDPSPAETVLDTRDLSDIAVKLLCREYLHGRTGMLGVLPTSSVPVSSSLLRIKGMISTFSFLEFGSLGTGRELNWGPNVGCYWRAKGIF